MRINDTRTESYYTLFDEGLSSERFRGALQATEHRNNFARWGKFRQLGSTVWGIVGKHTLSTWDGSGGGADTLDSNKIAA